MNALTRDRLTYAVLAIAFILLVIALFGVIIHNDAKIQRWQRQVDELRGELADARAELLMWQGEMRGLVEGETNFQPRISKED